MDGRWKWLSRLKLHISVSVVVLVLTFHNGICFSSSLNSEGLALLTLREKIERDPFKALSSWSFNGYGDSDHCSWFGVECYQGNVVILDLRNLCLEGTLAPELGRLAHLKSIILRNNSFSGNIPKEIGELMELEVLDLGYNNFSGPFPSEFSNNLSLTTLLLDNNRFLGSISFDLYELEALSEVQADENQLRGSCNSRGTSRNAAHVGNAVHRMLLQAADTENPPSPQNRIATPSSPEPSQSFPPSPNPVSSISSPSPSESPSFSPAGSPSSLPSSPSPLPAAVPGPAPATPPVTVSAQPQHPGFPLAPAPGSSQVEDDNSKTRRHVVLVASIVGSSVVVLFVAIGVFFFRSNKVVTVKPWATGLSGQLQKAFVTGVPKLKRSELEAACEDFSNIIGCFSEGTVYKGTLSSGVEIAVTSAGVISRKEWSKNLEARFRKKIDTLSKVNHKNFVNLIGYCEEEEPFTRMMVFEYAPNGTLFEHLHIKESEHLDWGMRLRIAMGMAYCLEYLHQLVSPVAHENLLSSSIYLTEDYAAKISDFSFWNDSTAAKIGSISTENKNFPSADPESNVYNFGVILFEMITGKMPYTVGIDAFADWASDFLRKEQPLKDIVDPTLKSFQEVELEKLLEVIQNCVHPDPKLRPTMSEVVAKLKEITAMGPDGATPKLSPLWWAELEILSTEGS